MRGRPCLRPRGAVTATLCRPHRLGRFVSAELPALTEVEGAVRQLGLAMDPSELHGALCGWLAGGGAQTADWLVNVLVDEAAPQVAPDSPLDRLRRASAAQLEDRGFGFELLLPDADASLTRRSGAVFDWCRGFLGGFGLAAGAKPALSEEGGEALVDIARLAAATAQEDGDDEDEEALIEIEEFIRVAVLLLHGDCVLAVQHRRGMN
ncbi:MAG: hypothetical protein JWL98_2282 [Xanthomonadaceae bacterium]|nr:hypothetical protein [Xanthomonadaceae bacterium]